MKKNLTKHSKLMNLITCFIALVLVSCSTLNAQAFKLSGVSDLVQVFEDGYKLPPSFDTIKIFGIRGEVLSGQCVIQAKNNLTNVTVELSALKNTTNGNSFPSNAAGWDFVGSVSIAKNAGNQPKTAVIRTAPANFPDYLMAEKKIDVNKGTYKSVYLTISIPESAFPGTYAGKVTVKSAQGEQSLPLFVKVYPLSLPAERHLKVTEWYSTGRFARVHGIQEEYSPEWFAMLKKYAENMAAHRQNVFEVPFGSIAITKLKNGFDFDFTRFDQIAQVFWNTGKMNYIETGAVGRFTSGGFASTTIDIKSFSVKDSATGEKVSLKGEEVLPQLLPAFESHLRQKGWLRKTLFHINDEPSHHNALDWIRISSYVHHYAPELVRLDAQCTSFILENMEIAVPKLDHLDSGYDIYRKWQEKGNELWFYTVGIFEGSMYPNKTIDMPVIDNRILHWINYKIGAVGYLHWGWNQWTEDPYKAPGQHTGDGWHVYPVKDGVLNSLRWEQMRNGIQDYEYFWMIEQKVKALKDSLGARFSWIDPTQRGKEIASQVAMSMVRHSDDPQVLYKAKIDAIKELLDFSASPRVYIQTNPIELGPVINRSPVELLGWTEPGTSITVNGTALPVAKDGLFMERYLVFVGGKLEIKAKNNNMEKVITRVFNVTY